MRQTIWNRILAPALCVALLGTLAGCGPREAPDSGSPPEAEPLHLARLAVEFSSGGDPDVLLAAAERMPETLQTALADAGVQVDEVRVTLGASPAATALALAQGGVDVAFLPAEAYAAADPAEAPGLPVLADAGPLSPGESASPGRTAELFAAPSEYGRSLAGRAGGGAGLSWTELDHARWGVLDAASDLGYRYPGLWLADRFDGRTLSALSQVRTYGSYEALLRAAAAEEIDVFPCTWEAAGEWEAAWTLEPGRTDSAGHSGLGRPAPLGEELASLGTTERCLTRLVVVRQDGTLGSGRFLDALRQALAVPEGSGDLLTLAGAEHFAPLAAGDLEPVRRLLALEESAT